MLHVGYVVEPPYPTFSVHELLAVREQGVRVTAFNSFRPFTQPYAEAESLRQESRYFPDGYRGLVASQLGSAAASPSGSARAAAFVLRHRLPPRLLVLSAHYARCVRRDGIQVLHATYGTTPATIAMLTSWMAGVPYGFTCHAYEMFLPNPLLPSKVEHAAYVTVVSEFAKRFVVERFGVRADKLRVVYLGVDTQAIQQRPPRAAAPPYVVACVASLVPPKGHSVLLRACRRLVERGLAVRVRLVGDGELRPALERQQGELGLAAHAELLGWRPPDEVMRILNAADAFTLPCVVDADGNRDGIPVALMEAMAIGLPVVSTTVSGIPELIENDVSGLLVPSGDDAALADALQRTLTDAALAARLGAAARRRIEGRFDRRASASRMIELFRDSATPSPS